ncbi:MAG: rhodanese-like domain-containing protein [Actinomycetota bacterium]|nr:rhodanese-like domain-containing protein [Actinomycetota bacterium]
MTSEDIPEINPLQAYEAISNGTPIVDVREADEFDAGHIADAISLPLSTISESYREMSLPETLIINCRSGARSARATEFLRSIGYNAYNLTGGVIAWTHAGLPIETSDGRPPVIA